jgi:hypothetical protein
VSFFSTSTTTAELSSNTGGMNAWTKKLIGKANRIPIRNTYATALADFNKVTKILLNTA